MSDSRTMILQMLAEGKITVEESERLLKALNKEDEVRGNSRNDGRNSNGQSPYINVFPNIPFLEATKLGLNIFKSKGDDEDEISKFQVRHEADMIS